MRFDHSMLLLHQPIWVSQVVQLRSASSDIGSASIAARILSRRCSSGDRYNVTFGLHTNSLVVLGMSALSTVLLNVNTAKRFDNIVTFLKI